MFLLKLNRHTRSLYLKFSQAQLVLIVILSAATGSLREPVAESKDPCKLISAGVFAS